MGKLSVRRIVRYNGDAMRLFKRVLKWVGLGVGAVFAFLMLLLLLLPVVFQVLPFFLKPKVDAEIAAIKARGEPVSQIELKESPIPNSENGSLIFAKVFAEMKKPKVKDDLYLLGDLTRRNSGPKSLNQAGQPMHRLGWLIPLIKAGASNPNCRFPVNWDVPPMQADLPHLGGTRDMARLLWYDARIRAHKGEMDDALDSALAAFRLGESLKNEPGLISQVNRKSIVSGSAGVLSGVLEHGSLSEVDAKKAFDVLGGIDLTDSLYLGLIGDQACAISLFDEIRVRPHAMMKQVEKSPMGIGKIASEPPEKVSPFWRSLLYADELFYLRTMSKMIKGSRLPYYSSEGEDLMKEPEFPRYALMTGILLPSTNSHRWRTAQARVSGGRIALALAAYKARFGSYPESLQRLEARLGWKLPDDPFSDKPFRYKRQGKGFLLCSLGPNLKDDGGIVSSNPREPDEKDIVWKMDH